jgi:hypothetical protein
VVTTALAATSQSSATPALAVTTALSPAGKPAAPQTTPAHTSKTNNVQVSLRLRLMVVEQQIRCKKAICAKVLLGVT